MLFTIFFSTSNSPGICSRPSDPVLDVNGDGCLNALDSTAITQVAALGSDWRCGAIVLRNLAPVPLVPIQIDLSQIGACPNQCTGKQDGVLCDDGDLCTTGDHCKCGQCIPTSSVSCALPFDQCHGQGQCDPATGLCSVPPLTGTSCNDGNDCTGADTCQNGRCIGSLLSGTSCQLSSPQGPCLSSSICTLGVCGGGTIQANPCDDRDACTENDICSLSGNCLGTPLSCINCLSPYKCSCGTCTCPSNEWVLHQVSFSGLSDNKIRAEGQVFGCTNGGGQGCSSGGFISVFRNDVLIGKDILLQLAPGCKASQWRGATYNGVIYSPEPFTFPGQSSGPFLFADQKGFLFGSEGPVTVHLYACQECGFASPYRLDVTIQSSNSKKRDILSETFSVGGTAFITAIVGTE